MCYSPAALPTEVTQEGGNKNCTSKTCLMCPESPDKCAACVTGAVLQSDRTCVFQLKFKIMEADSRTKIPFEGIQTLIYAENELPISSDALIDISNNLIPYSIKLEFTDSNGVVDTSAKTQTRTSSIGKGIFTALTSIETQPSETTTKMVMTLVSTTPYSTVDGNVTVVKATFSMDYSVSLLGSRQSIQNYE